MRFGILMTAQPGRAAFRYPFRASDAVWLARFLASAGPRARGQRREIAWRALERFADAGGRRSMTFGDFVQQRAPSVVRAPWQALPAPARAIALAATTGRLTPSPGNQRVFVQPAGGRGQWPHTVRPGGARSNAGYGWGQGEYEEEYEANPGEPAPTGDGGADAPPPVAKSNGAQPPVGAPDADAGAEPDAGPEGEPPPEEPVGPPADFNTADGNTLTLTPQLIQQLLATLRKHPRRHWQRKYPWLRQALAGGTTGGQPWGGQQWPGRSWTTRQGGGHRRWPQGTWSGRPWRGRAGGGAWSRGGGAWSRGGGAWSRGGGSTWRGRPLISRATVARPWLARKPIVQRMRQLARSSRKIGNLRSRRTGQRYPVFGAKAGGRNYRIVTRPRKGMQHEIVMVRSSPLGAERPA